MAGQERRQVKKTKPEPDPSNPEPLHIDEQNKKVWKGEQLLRLAKRPFEVLCYLVKHKGQLVEKAELLRTFWGAEVYEEALTRCMSDIRSALKEDPKSPCYLETVHGYGYCFIGPFLTVASKNEEPEPQADSQASTPNEQDAALGAQNSALAPHTLDLTLNVVGRESELERLHEWLQKALSGERQLVFVSGEAGVGKTTTVRAFLHQVVALGGVAIGRGQCIEHYGPGEAYLPVLEAIGRLCRDPRGAFLVEWMKQHLPMWLMQLPTLLSPSALEELHRKVQGATRERMLREMSEGLELLTQQFPFVMVLEDVHWSDASTLDLLTALVRRPERARLLIIATYRPEEGLAEGRPLRAMTQELRGHGLCQDLVLTVLGERAVDDYVKQRFPASALPPRLPQVFHQITGGNPLFLVAVIDELIARGVMAQLNGCWMLQGSVDKVSAEIPESIRQLIGKQIEQLNPVEQQVVAAASVAGLEFSAAAVAAATEIDVAAVEACCTALAQRQNFLQQAGLSEWPDGVCAARYRFRHALYQYLWNERVTMSQLQRFHQRVGERLEAAYRERAHEIAAELAVHFEQGRDVVRAAHYHTRAVEKAIRSYSYQEAVMHLKKGLELLNTLPDTPERAQQELALRTTLGISLQAIRGYGNPEVEQAYVRAQKLLQQVREPAQLFRVLFGLWQFHLVQAEYQTARELGTQLLNLAENAHDTGLLVEAHGAVGVTLFHLGETQEACSHLEQSTSLYEPDRHRTHVQVYSQDPWVACRSYSGQALWLLGYPDQALQRTQEAWRYAQELAHPFSQAFALHDMILIRQFHGNVPVVQQEATALLTLSREHGFPMWELAAIGLQGWAHAELGQPGEGLDLMQQGSSLRRDIGTRLRIPYHQTRLAELYGKAGQSAEGLAQLEKAFALSKITGECWWEAEMYRIKGELLLQKKRKD